jgi:hypothetical protein
MLHHDRSRGGALTRAAALAGTLALAAGAARAQDHTFFDNGQFALRGLAAGALEPPAPVFLNGVRVNNPGTPGDDVYSIIDVYDRVPGTSSFPLTFVDVIASSYSRPLVQLAGGRGTAIGTSVTVCPSFRTLGGFSLVPSQITRADVATGPGADRFSVRTLGAFGARATFDGTRRYPDPPVGRSEIRASYRWTATQTLTLPTGGWGVGFDAFRLCMLSSMLGSLARGEYDANLLGVEDAQGREWTAALADQPRGRHLFPTPRPTGVGRTLTLYKDRAATWNPGGPSVAIRVDSIGAPGAVIAVQGWLDASTNPNDDSLNVWFEWMNPPNPVPAGFTLDVAFTIIATPPSDVGDPDHDQRFTYLDLALVRGRFGRTIASPDFDAYADLDRNLVIDERDDRLLRGRLCTADVNADGVVDFNDLLGFLNFYNADDGIVDLTGDGVVDFNDLLEFLNGFNEGC